MGSSDICLTYDPIRMPWVTPYDRDHFEGEYVGAIDEIDVSSWADKTLSDAMKSNIPSEQFCALFRANLIVKRFQAQHVDPEISRETPLSTDDRRRQVSGVLMDAMAADVEAGELRGDVFGGCKKSCNCELHAFDFFYGLLSHLDVTAEEVMTSLQYDSSKLAMCGIGFDKVPGDYAVITNLEHLEDKTLIPLLDSARIVAIDGVDISPLTEGEVRNLLRGPDGSEASLMVIPGDSSEPIEVKISRAMLQPVFDEMKFK
jgi:hypothetical protein